YDLELKSVSLAVAEQRLADHVYHQATYNYLKRVLEEKELGRCSKFSIDELSALVNATFSARGIFSGNVKALRFYELGNLELLRGNGEAAFAHYQQALTLRNDVQVGIVEVVRLASKGYHALALIHLHSVREHNERMLGSAVTLSGSHEYRWINSELDRLKQLIEGELGATHIGTS